MSKIVFILGAGASKAAGAPLMNDFLDVAEGLLRGRKVPQAADHFELVFKACFELDRIHAKSSLRLHNLEEVFAAFEMAQLLGTLGDLKPDEISRLPGAMQQLILHTLEETVPFDVRAGRIIPPSPYDQFVRRLVDKPADDNVSVITFNYDLCLDVSCYYSGIDVDYCLGSDQPRAGVKLLKLHGSLNWGECQECGKIVAWEVHEYTNHRSREWTVDEGSPITLQVGSDLGEFHHCGKTRVLGPFIVPPTWNKGQHHLQLESVWRAAAELREAEEVRVCGYSLPETDQFFRYLYALGSIGPARLKRFWVADPDTSGVVENRFKALLGRGVEHRFDFLCQDFEEALMYRWGRFSVSEQS